MLSTPSKRQISSSFPSSPSKRTKTPSPQKPIFKGVYTPSKTRFVLRLNQVTLTSPESSPTKGLSDPVLGTKGDSEVVVTNVSTTTEDDVSGDKDKSQNPSVSFNEESGLLEILPSSASFRRNLKDTDHSDSSLSTGACSFSPHLCVGNSTVATPKVVEMPFTLVSNAGVQRHPLRHEVRMLREIWSEIRMVILIPPYLTVVCDTVPLTIPQTIAGVPCHFTLNEDDIPLQGTFCRGKPIVIGEKQEAWVLPTHATRIAILESLAPFGICSIVWLGTRWLLEVETVTKDTKHQLPSLINGLVASFRQHFEPKQQSLSRAKIPSAINVDDSNYFPQLHAGMLLSDGERITTSGCPVFNPSDPNQYFTIASHGFVTGSEVRHPLGNSRIVGMADKQFGETEISLCRITDTEVKYTVDCFAGSNSGIKLRRLVKEEDTWIGKELFFDSPLTGLGTGYVVGHGTRVIPSDSPDPEIHYVANLWVNFEHGGDDLKEGCCGSPLFDKHGDVYAFFHYYTTDDTATSCPCPDPLIDAGYSLGIVSEWDHRQP